MNVYGKAFPESRTIVIAIDPQSIIGARFKYFLDEKDVFKTIFEVDYFMGLEVKSSKIKIVKGGTI